ncbi:MAG: ATP-binding cassette domain-containing protein [Planctomycetota bacterium]
MIRLTDVVKRFGDHAAVDGISLSIKRGTTCALIGPSGCGKSTLLRVMLGLLPADSGAVEFDGRSVAGDGRTLRKRVGYAIQSGGLFPHLTSRQNVMLPARAHGVDAESRTAELAGLVRLEPALLDRYPSELSGGQRQRVALMRALVLTPEALLLDEPLGALDPVVRSELQTELKALFATLGKTVVLVTHDLAEAAYLAPDDIVLLRDGTIAQRGPFAELREKPADAFVSGFVEAQSRRVAALVAS